MKKQLFFLLALFAVKIAGAQSLTINGTVKDSEGNTVALAFVQDKTDKTATRTDTLGRFTLVANPNATLFVSSAGYESRLIDVKGNAVIQVVLKLEKSASPDEAVAAAARTPSGFNDYTGYQSTSTSLLYGSGTGGSAMLPTFKYTEATKGNRYLFNDWVSGFVVSPLDSVYKNSSYGFNYDKIGGGLLLTQDKRSAIQIDAVKIKSFTLYNNIGQALTFEYVPEINKTHYPQLIAAGGKYKIYKLTITSFVKNNYSSDGMTSTGNNYDEYVDDDTFFVLNVKTKQLQTLDLKKKSIKKVFAEEGKRLDAFFDAYDGTIDVAYLHSLGDYMNQ